MNGSPPASDTPRRIVIVGQTSTGKSTLGARLGAVLGVPVIELDALYWEPGWRAAHTDVLRDRLATALETAERASGGWCVAGGYLAKTRDLTWPRADTVVWLDLPLWRIVARVITRSIRRARSGERLWGTNTELFARLLRLWSPTDSLFTWAVTRHWSARLGILHAARTLDGSAATFVRLRSPREVATFEAAVRQAHLSGGAGRSVG